jgi:hypothetical protein
MVVLRFMRLTQALAVVILFDLALANFVMNERANAARVFIAPLVLERTDPESGCC